MLRFGELIDKNGEFTQTNIQCSNKKITTPLQQVKYICREGENEYQTQFAIFGFQYVEVKSQARLSLEDVTAIAVYSDMEETVSFDSSNVLLNRLVDATRWSAKNNSGRSADGLSHKRAARLEWGLLRFFAKPPVISLTMILLPANISGIFTTGRKKTVACLRLHRRAALTFI